MKRKKGFTLIELIAVLVILAILALIVTPLVMNIIRKAKISADKRSIDAYGRSIEIAIAGYLLDTGKFPTDISQLTIEYSGDRVECSTTQLNDDSSVFLAGCRVAGRSVDYTYGSDKSPTYTVYNVGDQVTYNNVDYYVIKESGAKESTVTMLKAEPLTVDEVNQYGEGHVNRYTQSSVGTAFNQNGYGGMAYYTSETCGYVNGNLIETGCTTDYNHSEIRYVVDGWKNERVPEAIEARLISKNEYQENFAEEEYQSSPSDISTRLVPQYEWMFNEDYSYWTNTPYIDSISKMWGVYSNGELEYQSIFYNGCGFCGLFGVVRPVITISKTALSN